MIITTISELRFHSPAHALDNIDGLTGFIDNSEHDFLEDKLGTPLYDSLCQWYDKNSDIMSHVNAPYYADTDAYNISPYNRLCLMAQRCVAFDALGRAAGMQGVSVNNAGINQMSAEDYKPADREAISTYRQTCVKEAHAALNQLLRTLEQWCRETATVQAAEGSDDATVSDGLSAEGSDTATVFGGLPVEETTELREIVTLWQQSRYYYLAAHMLIPSATVMQDYLDIYESREKFIQLLPDLRFIQEEIIADSISEGVLQYLIAYAVTGTMPVVSEEAEQQAARTILGEGATDQQVADLVAQYVPAEDFVKKALHRLRKVVVAHLICRTTVIKYSKEQKVQAHDDGVRMLQNAVVLLTNGQHSLPLSVVSLAPFFAAPVATASDGGSTATAAPADGCRCVSGGHAEDNAACWTPPLL